MRELEINAGATQDNLGDQISIEGFIRDTTRRRNAEEALRKAEERYRAIFEYAPVSIFRATREGRYLQVNPEFARVWGADSPEQMVKEVTDISKQIYTSTNHRNQLLDQLAHKGRIHNIEHKLRRRDGSIFWALTNVRAIQEHEGEGDYEGFMHDITEYKSMQQQLHKTSTQLLNIIDFLPDATMVIDAKKCILAWNKAMESLTDVPQRDALGQGPAFYNDLFLERGTPLLCDFVFEPQKADALLQRQAANSGLHTKTAIQLERVEHTWIAEFPMTASTGKKHIWAAASPLFDDKGDMTGAIKCLRDITARKQDENISNILFHISNAINITHDLKELFITIHTVLNSYVDARNFYFALVNEKKDRLEFPYFSDERHRNILPLDNISSPDVQSGTLDVIRGGEQIKLYASDIRAYSHMQGPISQCWLGTPLKIRDKVIGCMTIQHYENQDFITERDSALMTAISEQVALAIERKRNEELLTHQALHDSLTALPNRTLFHERLERCVSRAGRSENYNFAVLMLDLDRFKLVNDTMGHLAGDLLLQTIARRVQPILRASDTIARLGGDEFAILLEEFKTPRDVVKLIKRLSNIIEQPVHVGGKAIETTASIGIVLRTADYHSAQDIMRDADIAMYQAKAQGKGCFKVFNQSMHQQAMLALTMENDLASALRAEKLHIEYQPIIDALTLSIVGVEALARWNHPEQGPISPARFIPVAEDSGLIFKLGSWILEKSCTDMARWKQLFPLAKDMFISVNLSARQTSQSGLTTTVERALIASGLDAEALKLEITETAIMADPDSALQRISRLRDLGVKMAIDDFGTGYSSLAYLQRFPVDTLKIDRSFISSLLSDPECKEIVRAIVVLAHSLNLSVVAEGVETAEQLEVVKELQCGAVQGYYFHKPMLQEQFEQLLQTLQQNTASHAVNS